MLQMRLLPAAIAACLAVALAGCGQPSDKPGLTGMVRSQFVAGAVQSCSTRMRASLPATSNITPQMVTDYCTCSANKMADVISEAEMVQIAQDETRAKAATQSRVEAAAKSCAQSVLHVNL